MAVAAVSCPGTRLPPFARNMVRAPLRGRILPRLFPYPDGGWRVHLHGEHASTHNAWLVEQILIRTQQALFSRQHRKRDDPTAKYVTPNTK